MGTRISTKTVLQILALTLLFAALNYVGSALYHRASGLTTVKPFSGVALAILLICGRRALWPVLLTGMLGGMFAKQMFHASLFDTVSMPALVSASLLVIYVLIHRLVNKAVDFRDWKQLVGFIAIAATVSAITAFPSAAIAKGAGSPSFAANWLAWWVPTTLSYVIFTPVTVLVATARRRTIIANRVPIAVSLMLLAATLALTFVRTDFPLSFTVPLVLLIVTMMSEIEGAALGLVMTQVVYTGAIVAGYAPASVHHLPLGVQLFFFQAYLGVMVAVLLPVAAAVTAGRELRDREAAVNSALRDSEKRYREMAQREHSASKAKSEFLAAMSHELRTPLNAILGFSEVIKGELYGPLGHPKYREYAEDVHKSGVHLLDLINDVLDLSKIDAGKMELHESRFAVAALVAESVALLRDKAKGHVELRVSVPGDIDVTADRRFLKQILLNLLSNAIKFTPAGGTVSITAEYHEGLALSISDTGIGMSKDEIATAFSHYGQIDSRIARNHQGTGLGLPISKALAQLHGGELTADSTKGMGTRITLLLPQARVTRDAQIASA